MFNDLVDSSDVEHLEMLYLNGQKHCNSTRNLRDKLVDIEISLEEFLNISQQRERALKVGDNTVFQPGHDNPSVGQEEYRKE